MAGLEPHRAAKIVEANMVLNASPALTRRSNLLNTVKISVVMPPLDKISAIRMKSGAISIVWLVAMLKAIVPMG